jgi:hypothetical protein
MPERQAVVHKNFIPNYGVIFSKLKLNSIDFNIYHNGELINMLKQGNNKNFPSRKGNESNAAMMLESPSTVIKINISR